MVWKSKRSMGNNHINLVPNICKPRVILIIALVMCWDSKNGLKAETHHKNVRQRVLSSFLSQQHGIPQQEVPSERSIKDQINGRDSFSEEAGVVGPFVGNIADAEGTLLSPKQKKTCGGMPSLATRGLVGPTLKRSYFAATKEELDEKLREESSMREKREVKRTEVNDASLPWTCETKYEWRDMGSDHYPRFVRTAECKTRNCFNGFFRCRPRRYKTKVLRRVTTTDSASCEEDDVSLPESLRANWKFITVTISLCCDCVGRIPGTAEV